MWTAVGHRAHFSRQRQKPEGNRISYAENNCQLQILYSTKIPFKNKDSFLQGQLTESVPQSPIPKEFPKGTLQEKERWSRSVGKTEAQEETKKLTSVWINLNEHRLY